MSTLPCNNISPKHLTKTLSKTIVPAKSLKAKYFVGVHWAPLVSHEQAHWGVWLKVTACVHKSSIVDVKELIEGFQRFTQTTIK